MLFLRTRELVDGYLQSPAKSSQGLVFMPKYVAFLRAINVGGHIVKMDHLRRLFETMKFTNVETFIASGNVIFDSASKDTRALEKSLEAHLEKNLGYPVATFIRSVSELSKIAGYKPFSDSELNKDGHTVYIAFTADPPSEEAKRKLLNFVSELDDFHVNNREIYWLCRAKMMNESKFSMARLEKTIGKGATFRNSTTVKKIAEKFKNKE